MQTTTKNIYEGIEIILKQFKEKGNRIISIAGGSCSGKTEIIKSLENKLGDDLVVLALDSYYLSGNKTGNYDEPKALDLYLAFEHFYCLANDMPIRKPIYNFNTSSRNGFEIVHPKKHILFEGLFALYKKFRKISKYNVFMDVNFGVALQRRIIRDKEERARTEESVIKQFYETVKPMYELHVKLQKQYADLVIENNIYRPEFDITK